jgi:hypothetical protein
MVTEAVCVTFLARGGYVQELPIVRFCPYHRYHPRIIDVLVYIACSNNTSYFRWKYELSGRKLLSNVDCEVLHICRLLSLIRKRLLIRLLPALVLLYLKLLLSLFVLVLRGGGIFLMFVLKLKPYVNKKNDCYR